MPKFYEVGKNFQVGRVEVKGVKTVVVNFPNEFGVTPNVCPTLSDSGASHVPYKYQVTKTGFKLRFQNAYTGTVDWDAKEPG